MTDWKRASSLLLRMNWVMNIAVLALLVIGIFFIYSASSAHESEALRGLWKRQTVWAVAGLGCYAGFAVLDYRRLRRVAWWVYGLALALLVLVLLVGAERYGARRWLSFPGFDLQPAEIAKVGVLLVLARKLSRPGENLGHFAPVITVLVLAGVPSVLIMAQPDLGTALVLVPATAAMMFVAGIPLRTLGLLALVVVLLVGTVVGLVVLPPKANMPRERQAQLLHRVGISPYQKSRIEVFLGMDTDPFGAGWNKRQSEISVGSGGLKGKGFQKGTQNILGYLPRSVAPTDFIFAVIAEETGFMGSAVVLTLFGLVTAVGFVAALASRDKLGRLICVGIVAVLSFHILINMAMTVGLMPVTGLPLPLLSYGGTFMLITMSALGIVQSVYVRTNETAVVFEQTALWKSA